MCTDHAASRAEGARHPDCCRQGAHTHRACCQQSWGARHPDCCPCIVQEHPVASTKADAKEHAWVCPERQSAMAHSMHTHVLHMHSLENKGTQHRSGSNTCSMSCSAPATLAAAVCHRRLPPPLKAPRIALAGVLLALVLALVHACRTDGLLRLSKKNAQPRLRGRSVRRGNGMASRPIEGTAGHHHALKARTSWRRSSPPAVAARRSSLAAVRGPAPSSPWQAQHTSLACLQGTPVAGAPGCCGRAGCLIQVCRFGGLGAAARAHGRGSREQQTLAGKRSRGERDR